MRPFMTLSFCSHFTLPRDGLALGAQAVGEWGSDDAFGPGDAVPRPPPGGGRFAALDDRPVSADRLEFVQLNAARLRMCAAGSAMDRMSQCCPSPMHLPICLLHCRRLFYCARADMHRPAHLPAALRHMTASSLHAVLLHELCVHSCSGSA